MKLTSRLGKPECWEVGMVAGNGPKVQRENEMAGLKIYFFGA